MYVDSYKIDEVDFLIFSYHWARALLNSHSLNIFNISTARLLRSALLMLII